MALIYFNAEMLCVYKWLILEYVLYNLMQLIVCSPSPEYHLHKQLFANYNVNVRPVMKPNNSIDLKLNMYLLTIDSIDMKKRTALISMFLDLRWNDAFLVWNTDEFDGTTIIHVDPKQIWLPDLTIGNDFGTTLFLNYYHTGRAIVSSDGDVNVWPSVELEIGMDVQISKFPFDRQQIHVDVFSWTFTRAFMNIHFIDETSSVYYFKENCEWQITHTTADTKIYSLEGDTYKNLMYTFTLQRKPLYVMIHVMVPVVLTSLLNVLCFILPPESGEKITFSISVFLSLTVLQGIVNNALQVTSDGISVLVLYIGLQMIGSILTIVATVLQLHLYHKTENKVCTGSCNTSGHSRNITDLKENYSDETLSKHQQKHGNSNQANNGRLHAWAVFCCSFNRIGLIASLVWNIGLIVFFLIVVNS